MEQKITAEGYKQTEVGVIPESWNVKSLDEIANKIGSGKTPTGGSNVYKNEGIPLVRSQNVGWGKLLLDDIAFITREVHETFSGSELCENDVLLNITGASIGRSALANDKLSGGNVNQHVCIIRVNKNIDPRLINSLILSSLGQNQIDSYQAGGNREGLNFSQIKSMFFPIPSDREEQIAIANALSDVDALIASIEKLISKKQAIKTATMQQLLTGKKRLPPFDKHPDGSPKAYKQTELGEIPEDWDVVNFGELFEINVSRKKVRLDPLVSFVGMQDVSENAKLVSPSLLRYEKVKSGFTYFERSDVLVAKITPCFENGKGCFTEHLPTAIGFGSTEFHVLRATTSSFAKYIYFITVTPKFRNELKSEMVGSAGHRRVPFSALKNYQIPATRNKEEQIAIANILTDMDEEIQAFQQCLTKTQQIKQGMMQELLTGKTRLPFDKTKMQSKDS